MDQTIIARLRAAIAEVNVGELCAQLVRIPSYSFMPEQEKEIAGFIAGWFALRGMPAETQEAAPGRYNAVGTLPGAGDGKSLMLNGHLDTVPAYEYDEADPFSGRIENGRVHGRGACDMKGPLAAMMAAMAALKNSGVTLKGDLIFGGVADEEEAGLGVKHLIKHGPVADATIVGEPTNMHIATGQKGLEWIRAEVRGVKVHSSEMENGVNAIVMAARLITWLDEVYAPRLQARAHPQLGAPTLNIATIKGGDQPSTVPGACTLTFDRRFVPGETVAQVYAEIEDAIAELARRDPRFSAAIQDVFSGQNEEMPHLPFYVPRGHPLVRATAAAVRDATGKDAALTVSRAWTDAGFIANFSSSTALICGPGEDGYAHTSNESISIAQLEEAALAYALLAIEWCGGLSL